MTMADDGRIWFPSPGAGGYFCLNRAGQGGKLPGSIARPPEAAEAPLVGCSGDGRAMRVQGRRGVGLDYACTRPQAKLGPDGTAYVGTEAPDVRAFAADGTMAWKTATPCAAQRLLAGPGGRVVFACQDLSIHLIENGTLRWNKPGDGEMDEGNIVKPSASFVGLMDRNGTTYFVDRAADGSGHVHAMSASGDMLWTLKSPGFSASSIGFALPSSRTTSCPGGVRACSRNIHKCGMKLPVMPLSGLNSRIFITKVGTEVGRLGPVDGRAD